MPETQGEAKFTVWPQRLAVDELALAYRWSVYVVRVDLAHRGQLRALKIGMVGSGTIGQRLRDHARDFGPNELLVAWTLSHAVSQFEDDPAWAARRAVRGPAPVRARVCRSERATATSPARLARLLLRVVRGRPSGSRGRRTVRVPARDPPPRLDDRRPDTPNGRAG